MAVDELPPDHAERMERAMLALVGSPSAMRSGEPYTDDTEMALGVLEVLQEHGRIDQDRLAAVFARRYRARPDRGYFVVALDGAPEGHTRTGW